MLLFWVPSLNTLSSTEDIIEGVEVLEQGATLLPLAGGKRF